MSLVASPNLDIPDDVARPARQKLSGVIQNPLYWTCFATAGSAFQSLRFEVAGMAFHPYMVFLALLLFSPYLVSIGFPRGLADPPCFSICSSLFPSSKEQVF